jgi:hypothetical protein
VRQSSVSSLRSYPPHFVEDPAFEEDPGKATPVARILRNGQILRGNRTDAPPGATLVKFGECKPRMHLVLTAAAPAEDSTSR